ncbi:MAG TPA: divalent-cation tolerance protein CutA [Candidatus Binataceae bacterium]|nr:divalent-cation tolerance protein CutA [Candidatus Binataceae bacterium]
MTGRRASSAILILVTCANDKQAESIAQALVTERLAACVNLVGPIRSIYRWRNKVEDDSEILLLIKTRASLFPRVERRVRELHSYEVPEVMALPFQHGSPPYVAWLLESTASGTRKRAVKK